MPRKAFSEDDCIKALLWCGRHCCLSRRWEIGNAPTALRKLHTNRKDKVTAEECGLHIDPNSVPPALRAQRRRRFMSYHPLLAALDADHDGEISAWEIDHTAASLKKLDRNHDGYLTADKLVPFEMAGHAGLR